MIRKVVLRPESKYSYMTTALLGAVALILLDGARGFAGSLGGLALMLAVHAGVLRLTLRRVDEPSMKRWSFRSDWPWIGPLPIMDTSLSLFRRLHFHLFLIGCCLAGLFYPWAPSSFLVSLVYWHFWLLAPRLSLLWKLRRERGDGILRLDAKEVLYYHQ